MHLEKASTAFNLPNVPKAVGNVDTRFVYGKLYRLRFFLSPDAAQLANDVCSPAHADRGQRLTDVSLAFLAGSVVTNAQAPPAANGGHRWKVWLWPNQYDVVRAALDVARQHTADDAAALALICRASRE